MIINENTGQNIYSNLYVYYIYMQRLKLLILFVIHFYPMYSQIKMDHYAEVGKTMMSNGVYSNVSTLVEASYNYVHIHGGALLSVINPQAG